MDDRVRRAVEEELLSKHATVWGQAFDVIGQRLDAAVDYYTPFVEAVMRRLLLFPPEEGGPRHQVLGLDPTEYDRRMAEGRVQPGWKGMPASLDPRYHAHPDLGIIGHSHSPEEVARAPHTHRLVVEWDHEVVPLPGDEG